MEVSCIHLISCHRLLEKCGTHQLSSKIIAQILDGLSLSLPFFSYAQHRELTLNVLPLKLLLVFLRLPFNCFDLDNKQLQ